MFDKSKRIHELEEQLKQRDEEYNNLLLMYEEEVKRRECYYTQFKAISKANKALKEIVQSYEEDK